MILSQRCWIHSTHRKLEMLLCDTHSFQNLCVNFLGLYVYYIHFLSNALQG